MWSHNLVSTLELMPSVMAGTMDWLLSQIGLEDVSGSKKTPSHSLLFWALARIKQQLCTFFPFFLGLEPGGYLEVMLQQVNGLFLSSPNAGYNPWNKNHETTVGSFHILGHPGGQCGRRLRCMVVDKHFSKYSTNERDVAWKRGEDRWSGGVQQLWNITWRWMWICSKQSRGGRF